MAPVRPSIHAGSVEFPCHIKPWQGQETDMSTLIKEQSKTFQRLLSGFEAWGGEAVLLAGLNVEAK